MRTEEQFIKKMTAHTEKHGGIEPSYYNKFDVKRGLRDACGAGVVVGLTKIGEVDGYVTNANNVKLAAEGCLLYRGIDVVDLVHHIKDENRFGYEECSYLLLFGKLPTHEELEEYNRILGAHRELPGGFARDMILVAPSSNIMNKLARSVLALYSYDPDPDNISIENVLRQSINLIACFPSLISYGYQAKRSYYHNESLYLHYPLPELSTAENILRMIRPTGEFTDLEAKTLDLSLILHAEHGGGNNSTFTTHLVSSSGTDTYSTIAAACGSLKGPKHGGANTEVLGMVDDMRREVKSADDEAGIDRYLHKLIRGKAFDHSGRIYGLGHAVYTLSDPRTGPLREMARLLAEEKDQLEDFALYEAIEKRGPDIVREVHGKDLAIPANVDLYSGFVYRALNMPDDLTTATFAAARISGWCAHRLEELASHNKIMRPAYINVMPAQTYLPLEERTPGNDD